MGILHVANIGSVTAVLSRDGCPKRISYCHTTRDAAEKQRVVSKGAAVSSSGQVVVSAIWIPSSLHVKFIDS